MPSLSWVIHPWCSLRRNPRRFGHRLHVSPPVLHGHRLGHHCCDDIGWTRSLHYSEWRHGPTTGYSFVSGCWVSLPTKKPSTSMTFHNTAVIFVTKQFILRHIILRSPRIAVGPCCTFTVISSDVILYIWYWLSTFYRLPVFIVLIAPGAQNW